MVEQKKIKQKQWVSDMLTAQNWWRDGTIRRHIARNSRIVSAAETRPPDERNGHGRDASRFVSTNRV